MKRILISTYRSHHVRFCLFFLSIVSAFAGTISAQTNTFTYQGRLTDNNLAAVGTYEMQFRVFDAATAGNQLPVGTPVTLNFTVAGTNPVTVSNGAFTVQLNFGAGVFTGADRWLEISVRKPSDPPGFTLLTPRQPITSSPYSIKTINANAADSLSPACVLCITNAQISGIDGSKVTGTVASATTAGTATTANNASNLGGLAASMYLQTNGNGSGLTNVQGTLKWVAAVGTSQLMVGNTGYYSGFSSVAYTLPAAPVAGETFRIVGFSSWSVAANPGQTIYSQQFGFVGKTLLTAPGSNQSIELLYLGSSNFVVLSYTGTFIGS